MEKVTKQTLIKAFLDKHPEVAEVLMSYGLQCVNCHFSEFDTIEDGANVHGMSNEDMEMMIRDVNKVIGGKNARNKDN